jgi:hypothetical protein
MYFGTKITYHLCLNLHIYYIISLYGTCIVKKQLNKWHVLHFQCKENKSRHKLHTLSEKYVILDATNMDLKNVYLLRCVASSS